MLDRLKLQHLRYFIAVAEELHFSRAAQKMALNEWELGEQVRTLEEMLGVTLLVRNPHQMELSPAGELLLKGASALLRDTLQLLKQVQDLGEAMQDQVRVGYHAPELDPFLTPLLGRLLGDLGMNLSRVFLPETELRKALLDQQVDVAVGHLEHLQDEALTCEVLLQGPWSVVVPEHHPLADQTEVPPQALRSERLLLLARPDSDLPHPVLDLLHSVGVDPEIAYEPGQAETAEVMVEQGTGLWVTGSFMVHNLPPGLRAVPLAGVPEVTLAVAHRPGDLQAQQVAEQLLKLARDQQG